MAGVSAERVRDDLMRLADRGRGVRDFSREAARIIGRAVPFDGACMLTLDPVAGVPTGEVVEGGLSEAVRTRMAEIELAGVDVDTFAGLLRSRCPVAGLSEVTGDELWAVLVEGTTAWGALALLRTTERRPFTPAETALVASMTTPLATGLRRALLGAAPVAAPVDEELSSGVAVLGADNAVALADEWAERWLAEVDADRPGGRLPPVVTALARRARMGDADPRPPSEARVLTASGTWVAVRASALGPPPDSEVAVVLEPAGSRQLAPLIADAYGLTERERVIRSTWRRVSPPTTSRRASTSRPGPCRTT
jgi:hypothetical protein